MLYFNHINNPKEYFLYLDGIDDYFTSNFDSFNTILPFSFFCRFSLRDRSESTLVSMLDSSNKRGFFFFSNATVLGFSTEQIALTIYDGVYRGGIATTIPLNEIINLHLVHSGGADINNMTVYVNGIDVTETRGGFVPNMNTTSNIASKTFFNSPTPSRNFSGEVFNQSLVNYAKTIEEVGEDNSFNKQILDANKGDYLYNIEFKYPPNVTSFQTAETNPKTVKIYR